MSKKKKNTQQTTEDNNPHRTFTKNALKKYVFKLFTKYPKQTFNCKQIAKHLNIHDKLTRSLINVALEELVEIEKLEEEMRGKYRLKVKPAYVTGQVDMSPRGTAYIICEEQEEDVFVSQHNLNRALHGDIVRVYLYARRRKRNLEGEVVEVIKRAKSYYVGKLDITRSYAFLIPDNKNMPYDIFIPPHELNEARDGQKAIVEIVEWVDGSKNPIGQIIELLGDAGDHDVEMHAILAEFELPYRFPENVEAVAQKITPGITRKEIAKRRDFRKITTFTIDPHDAKDFDDALSLQKLDNGHWEVGIHIADVSHYIPADSLLDCEAFERGTSVYLVDRVVPMLPEHLSNGICSLRPQEEKLTFSAVFELDDKANIHNQWFGRTVICSDRRFTYEEAQTVIESGKGELKDEILTLNDLANSLRDQRFKNGAITFDRVEVKFNLDEQGAPVSLYFKEGKAANHLIEEFMLLANQKVAEFIGKEKNKKKPKTFVYRIHDEPDTEKLSVFAGFIRQFGYSLKTGSNRALSNSMNDLLRKVKGRAEQNVIEQLAVRSMAKAEYSTQNIGHYGLAFDYYTHFTSPIRRYPDMMVHRLLARYLEGQKSVTVKKYEHLCQHASEMERRAAQAERASIRYKQIEFMKSRLGHVYDGVISGVTEWGMYVEMNETKIEGMIALRDLDDDHYILDDKNFTLVGQRTKKRYRLGDSVKVLVMRADLTKKHLDFKLFDDEV